MLSVEWGNDNSKWFLKSRNHSIRSKRMERWWHTEARWQRWSVRSDVLTVLVQTVWGTAFIRRSYGAHMLFIWRMATAGEEWPTDFSLSTGGPVDIQRIPDRSVNQAVALRIAFNLVSPVWLMIYRAWVCTLSKQKDPKWRYRLCVLKRDTERAGWLQSGQIYQNKSRFEWRSVSIRISPSNLKPELVEAGWSQCWDCSLRLSRRDSLLALNLKEIIFNIWKTNRYHCRDTLRIFASEDTSNDILLQIHFQQGQERPSRHSEWKANNILILF